MIGEWGLLALILSLCLALCQASVTWFAVAKNNQNGMRLSRYTAVGQLIFTGLAFVLLGMAFLQDDWSLRYVATNANSAMPWIYRLCAVWGAHEGSMLLWVLMLTAWMSAVALAGKRLPLAIQAQVLAVLALIAIGFDLFILTTSNPFIRLFPNVPAQGIGLNPLLQDPGLVSHPPMLYMGYVGFSVAFAFAIVGLITKRLDATWAQWVRPWTLFAWASLTVGIVLGSWWAYRELGWGGWWFWDPVENASFMPWLAGTALIHSLRVTERQGLCKAWTVLLAVLAFSLSLLGTFLVRSGVLISVHAFAVDPARGSYILLFLMIVIGLSLLLYALRSRHLAQSGKITPLSREGLLLVNNLILFVALLTVLLGTLYPLFVDALSLDKISVGAPYFNAIFVPLMWPLMILMGFAPFLQWEGNGLRGLRRGLWWVLLAVVAAAGLGLWLVTGALPMGTWLGASVMGWLLVCSVLALIFPRLQTMKQKMRWMAAWQKAPMVVAHIGLAVCALGILFTVTYSRSAILSMHVGEQASLTPYSIQLDRISRMTGPNYQAQQADVSVRYHGQLLTVLHPQQRHYTQAGMQIAKTDRITDHFRDVYVALGAKQPSGQWGVRFYLKPFIHWIWVGGLLMALGSLLAIVNKRRARR
jgi:cytochrome c-type biogenesis protein CcmF